MSGLRLHKILFRKLYDDLKKEVRDLAAFPQQSRYFYPFSQKSLIHLGFSELWTDAPAPVH